MGSVLALGIFTLGYLLIALEYVVHINKSAVALFTGVILWVLAVLGLSGAPVEHGALTDHFEAIAELLFFLLAAILLISVRGGHVVDRPHRNPGVCHA